jgi:hypothetical protein
MKNETKNIKLCALEIKIMRESLFDQIEILLTEMLQSGDKPEDLNLEQIADAVGVLRKLR